MPILFILDGTRSSDVSEHQLMHLEGFETYRAIADEPRAQGRSSRTVQGCVYQPFRRNLAAFPNMMDLDNVILAGWSYDVTEQMKHIEPFCPGKIRAMVMIETGPVVPGATRDEQDRYLEERSDGFARCFTGENMEERQNVIAEFDKWMPEDPGKENLARSAHLGSGLVRIPKTSKQKL